MISENRSPYIVYMPSLRGNSAGLRVLAKLARLLKDNGETVFICSPGAAIKDEILKNYDGPCFLSFKHLLEFEARNVHPITIYPEVTSGNPLGASVIVRYVLGLPGVLGGTKEFNNRELLVGYESSLTELTKAVLTLKIEVLDQTVFYYKALSERPLTCFYAGKFRSLNGAPFGLPDGCIEIHRSGPQAQSPEEIADLFSKSAVFYTFEPTLLTFEAAMCGCPHKFISNEIFKSSYNSNRRYGEDTSSYTEGELPDHEVIANEALKELEKNEKETFAQLRDFVEHSQEYAIRFSEPELFRLLIQQRDGIVKYRNLLSFIFQFLLTQPVRRVSRLVRELNRLKRPNNRSWWPTKFIYRR